MLATSVQLPADPEVVAELGPGDSLGTGVAALLTGASTYIAVDLVEYAASSKNVEMVDAIAALLSERAPVPGVGAPGADGASETRFPSEILDDDRVRKALAAERVSAIRRAVAQPGTEHGGVRVSYSAGQGRVFELVDLADIVFSQAVLEHVDDLEQVYAASSAILRPGGFASHAIDFKSHHFSRGWNGHWAFSDREWAIIRGKRRYAINREPLSTHLRLIEAAGLEIVNVQRTFRESTIARSQLSTRFRSISDEDLRTSSALVQAVKR
jgi:SAM-dependent methyltransferase